MKKIKSKTFIFISLVLSFIGGAVFYLAYGLPWNLYTHSNQFEQYLEEKYQKDFELEDISYDVFHDTYHAYAHEVEDPEWRFYIGQNMGDKEITEAYDFELTVRAARKDVAAVVAEYLPASTETGVELISLEDKELEINVTSEEKVTDETQQQIKAGIVDKGYSTSQLFFHLKGN